MLDFTSCHGSRGNKWNEYPHRFENLMKGISDSSIKESLKIVVLSEGWITSQESDSLLKSLGFNTNTKIE